MTSKPPPPRDDGQRAPATRFFEAIAGRYERAYALPRDESDARMGRVLARMPKSASRVLDLGVGTGRELTSLLDAGYDVVGLDASPSMLARCARRTRPVMLVEADFWEALPFAASSFDVVLALHGTLAHPERDGDLAKLAGEVHRVLRARGAFIFEVPSPGLLATLHASPSSAAGHLRQTTPGRFVHVDEVVGLALEGRVLDEGEWRSTLGARFTVTCQPISPVEQMIVAERT